jgi:UDP-glucose:(heptosyl)LPS alpha-1,3-glucosyltransferase
MINKHAKPLLEMAQYRAADVTILPSCADAFGYVVSESLACGTPVIVSDQCGSSELIRTGKDGFVFQAGDVEGLVAALEQCEDPETLTKLRAGSLQGRERLGWDRYGSELIALYKRRLPALFTR